MNHEITITCLMLPFHWWLQGIINVLQAKQRNCTLPLKRESCRKRTTGPSVVFKSSLTHYNVQNDTVSWWIVKAENEKQLIKIVGGAQTALTGSKAQIYCFLWRFLWWFLYWWKLNTLPMNTLRKVYTHSIIKVICFSHLWVPNEFFLWTINSVF